MSHKLRNQEHKTLNRNKTFAQRTRITCKTINYKLETIRRNDNQYVTEIYLFPPYLIRERWL